MNKCYGCDKPKRWYHKSGMNNDWHFGCGISWKRSCDAALKFCGDKNGYAGFVPPELYIDRNKVWEKGPK